MLESFSVSGRIRYGSKRDEVTFSNKTATWPVSDVTRYGVLFRKQTANVQGGKNGWVLKTYLNSCLEFCVEMFLVLKRTCADSILLLHLTLGLLSYGIARTVPTIRPFRIEVTRFSIRIWHLCGFSSRVFTVSPTSSLPTLYSAIINHQSSIIPSSIIPSSDNIEYRYRQRRWASAKEQVVIWRLKSRNSGARKEGHSWRTADEQVPAATKTQLYNN